MSLLISSTFGRLFLLPDHSGLGGHIPGGGSVLHRTPLFKDTSRIVISSAYFVAPVSYFVSQCLIARLLCRESRKCTSS